MTLKGGRMSHSGFRGLEEGCKNAREDSHDRELPEKIGNAMEGIIHKRKRHDHGLIVASYRVRQGSRSGMEGPPALTVD